MKIFLLKYMIKYLQTIKRSLNNRIKKRLAIKQSKIQGDESYDYVKWLSYHVPKTAGTSLRKALEMNFERKAVFSCYKNSYAKLMSQGVPVYVNNNVRVIHGHFKFSTAHSNTYPQAKKIIWLRDPVERAFSTLNHWMRNKNSLEYQYIIVKFPSYDKVSSIELFNLVIKDKSLNKILNLYSYYLLGAKPNDFSFIGHVDNYNNDLLLLSSLMGLKLPQVKVNINPNKEIKPNRDLYEKYFQCDYKVYDLFMEQKNKFITDKTSRISKDFC